jgi:hypothetical protein
VGRHEVEFECRGRSGREDGASDVDSKDETGWRFGPGDDAGASWGDSANRGVRRQWNLDALGDGGSGHSSCACECGVHVEELDGLLTASASNDGEEEGGGDLGEAAGETVEERLWRREAGDNGETAMAQGDESDVEGGY